MNLLEFMDSISLLDPMKLSTLNCPATEAPCHIAKADLRTASEFNQYDHNVLPVVVAHTFISNGQANPEMFISQPLSGFAATIPAKVYVSVYIL